MIQLTLPEEIFFPLFQDAALSHVFDDGKMLADAIPCKSPAEILDDYERQKSGPDFSLKDFIIKNFKFHSAENAAFETKAGHDILAHIERLWSFLERPADREVEGSSLIPLPFTYIVPGGRFNEIYYWDSYFTMLGLKVVGRIDIIESMADNFAWMIQHAGFIPNGNRTYFLSRSQPPFFAMMVELLADMRGSEVYIKYAGMLKKEYNFWMNGLDEVSDGKNAIEHVVRLDKGEVLNRYWDKLDTPRSEMYAEDVSLAQKSDRISSELYKDLRSACESGWDFSSRWCTDPLDLKTIHTRNIIPVDLNCLLYKLEMSLSIACKMEGNGDDADMYKAKAVSRQNLIQKYCWNEELGYYFDYNFQLKKQTSSVHAAGIFPLSFGLCNEEQAAWALNFMEENLLFPGGLVTTTVESGQQWDAPNGWAPLQWMAVLAAEKFGDRALAVKIAGRWTALNRDVFNRTGKMMEKYNVRDTGLDSGGGEYPLQDGFGWTNGVYLAMCEILK